MQVIGTAGHVDHGKSSLVERLTGIDPDRFAEEKRRGLTLDLGFAWLTLPSGLEVGLIDVPGHERLIHNMLAGAGGMSVCLFVVAADGGWMPQSAEHLGIIDVLGIRHGVVALTKCDLVDRATVEAAAAGVADHLAPSSLAGAPVVACSSRTGAGLDRLVAKLDGVVRRAPVPLDAERPRLWIDRVFTIAGAGTVVTGTLAGGAFEVGDDVEVSPEGRRARIRAIQTHKRSRSRAAPGTRVALNLAGLDRHGAQRGDAVVRPGRWRPTARVDVEIRVLGAELGGVDRALAEKGAHLLYVGSAETAARIKLLRPARVDPGTSAVAQVTLARPLPLTRGDRFVLRDAGRQRTLGGGVVVDPLPPPARRGDLQRAAHLERVVHLDAEEALVALVEAAGQLDVREAVLRAGTPGLPETVWALGRLVVSAARRAQLEERVRGELRRHHEHSPLEQGLEREALRSRTRLPPDSFDALLASMDDVVAEGARVRLVAHAVRLDTAQQRAADDLLDRIHRARFSPPRRDELHIDPALVRVLVERGELVPVADFFLTRQRAQEARNVVRARIEEGGPVTVAEVRDLLGTTRRYAVPLCEWLDATGATARRGDVRILGP